VIFELEELTRVGIFLFCTVNRLAVNLCVDQCTCVCFVGRFMGCE
jgi:hypothetical protein